LRKSAPAGRSTAAAAEKREGMTDVAAMPATAWDEAAGPSIGERLSCLDQFMDFQVCFVSLASSSPVLGP